MHKLVLLIGPALFLVAELVLPAGSTDPATRVAIIMANSAAWEFGHQLILIAFAFLLLWLVGITGVVRQSSPLLAGLGLWFSGFAVLANFGVGVLQLVALELVQHGPEQQARSVLQTLAASSNLMTFVFLPYLGLVPGLALLAIALTRRLHAPWLGALLALAGVLICIGGIVQLKALLIVGGAGVVLFTLGLIRQYPVEEAAVRQSSTSR